MSGWAVVPADGVLVVSSEVARVTARGLGLVAAEYQRNAVPLPEWFAPYVASMQALADREALRSLPRSSERAPVCSAGGPCAGTVGVTVAADLLGVSERWIRQLAEDGELVGHRGRGRRWHIEKGSVMMRMSAA